MKHVTGIGRISFKSENPQRLHEWYEHLGIQREPHRGERRSTGANLALVSAVQAKVGYPSHHFQADSNATPAVRAARRNSESSVASGNS